MLGSSKCTTFAGPHREDEIEATDDRTLVVTLNSDVPAVFGASTSGEYERVRAVFGASDVELAGLARAGVEASFAPVSVKERLSAGVGVWLGQPG